MACDDRPKALAAWAQAMLERAVPPTLTPVAGDASTRSFYRIDVTGATTAGGQATLIGIDAPPPAEDTQRFLQLARRLRSAGLHTPEIIAADATRGFMLVEDLGDVRYADRLALNPDDLYAAAIDALIRLQTRIGPGDAPLIDYDARRFAGEAALIRSWFIEGMLALTPSPAEARMLESTIVTLAETLAAVPRVAVHLDWHSRNLLICPGWTPGVVDFQDARYGPVAYDIVSLLRDCYRRWPEAQVQGWLADYRRAAARAGVPGADDARFEPWFDLCGVQRHLKCVGIFARLWLRDGRPGYLADIERVLGYVTDVGGRHPTTAPLARWVGEALLPAWSAHPRRPSP